MKTIKLNSLNLVNFKGVRSLNVEFNELFTTISGANGTGKTTIFDAFLWLLFGKDSTGRSDSNFNIKTLDPATGKPILRLEHSVTGVLNVDGREIKLQRSYVEKWVKPRGTTEETLQNHATDFFVNNVKLATKREYDTEISTILPEDIFKMITNPAYFTSLKPEIQKQMLMEMAGDVSDDEVAALKPEYRALLDQLLGRSLAQFAKEISAKKKACNDVLKVIPSQIETAQRLMPEAEDWVALDKELAAKRKKLADIDAQLSDVSKQTKVENQRKINLQKQIGEKQVALTQKENEIRTQATAGHSKAKAKLEELNHQLRTLEQELQHKRSDLVNVDNEISSLNEILTTLRGQYKAINAEEITYPEGAFVCPTCKRELEVTDVEAKRAELLANFNQSKSDRLKKNQETGKAKVALLKIQTDAKERLLTEIAEIGTKITTQRGLIEAQKAAIPAQVDISTILANDTACIGLRNEIVELQNQMSVEVKPADVVDLNSGKQTLNESIQTIYKQLAKKEQIERAQKEVADLEEKRTQNNQALADLEKMEYIAYSFQKDKDAKLMERINGLFQIVSFSFVSDQLNGGEKLTCICTVNGTPYPDVNTAGKVNAGLDIINAICRSKGVSAPIFIDNRESVNNIITTISQVVNLVVSTDNNITIK